MTIYKKCLLSLLCLLVCAAVLPAAGCDMIEQFVQSQPEQSYEPPMDYDKLARDGYAQLEELYAQLTAQLPESYTASIPVPAAYSVSATEPDSQERIEQWMFQQQLLMFTPAIDALITDEMALCQAVTGDANAESISTAGDALRTGVTSVQSLPELYKYVAGLENSLFSRVGVTCAAENKDSFVILPQLATTAEGKVLMTIHTNFPLPGFEDGSYGYLLRLVMDGGDTEQTIADSVYSHEHITYGSSYAVTFDLSSILKNVTPEQYFAGRNRVTFTLFARDNSFSWSEEYYKLRYSDGSFTQVDDRRKAIGELIINAI